MVRLFVALLLLAACGGAARPTPEPVLTDRVQIVEPADPADWGYDPAAIRVPSGTTVVWQNAGAEFHTVTSDDAGRPFDVAVDAGKDGSFTFTRPGTFAYHCGVHPQMKGVVIVCDGPCR